MLEQSLKNCSLWKGCLSAKDYLLWEESTLHWSRGDHEGEGVAEQIVFTVTSVSHPACPTPGGEGGGRRAVNEGIKLSQKERGWGQGKLFLFPSSFFSSS